jgi:periplasmic copper chaperone A
VRHLTTLLAFGLLVAGSSAFAADAKVGDLVITHPFAVPTPPGAKTGGAYLGKIENTGKTADALVSASSPAADRVEIHSMTMDGDVMRMRDVKSIPVEPGKAVAMSPPMGYHIMLVGLHAPLAVGQKIPMTLQFEHAGKVDVTVDVEARQADPMMQHMH